MNFENQINKVIILQKLPSEECNKLNDQIQFKTCIFFDSDTGTMMTGVIHSLHITSGVPYMCVEYVRSYGKIKTLIDFTSIKEILYDS